MPLFRRFLCVLLLVIHHAGHVKPSNVSGNTSPDCLSDKINKYSKGKARGAQPGFDLTWVLSEANSKFLRYLNLIADAQRQYKPCKRDKCGCHASVISEDLKMFKEKGISASSIQSVKAKQVLFDAKRLRSNALFAGAQSTK